MTTEIMLIISLIMVFIAVTIFFVIAIKRLRDDISGMEVAYTLLMKSYDNSLDMLTDINTKYAKCLDDRERFLNETNVRIKKLEMEIDKRDAEIAHMDTIIEFSKMKGTKDEKEEVKEEN